MRKSRYLSDSAARMTSAGAGGSHGADQLADRQRREEVPALDSASAGPASRGDERGDGRPVVLDPHHPAIEVDRAALGAHAIAGRPPTSGRGRAAGTGTGRSAS